MTWEDAEGIIDDQINIISLYGGMIRNIRCGGNLNNMGVGLDYQKRTLSTNLWWKKGSRITDEDYPWSCTKPIGYNEVDVEDLALKNLEEDNEPPGGWEDLTDKQREDIMFPSNDPFREQHDPVLGNFRWV